MNLAQSPDERFDVLTEDGRPTGETKRRADVHRDGYWHRAVHVWVWSLTEGKPYLLMNQRGKNKDTWPLALDATVGGHLGAGETVADAFREIGEELGGDIPADRLRYLFTRKRSSGNLIPGILDQEFQEVYIARDDRPLTDWRPNPHELEALVRVPLTDALRLFRGETTTATGEAISAADGQVCPYTLTPDQLLVRGGDRYFIEVAEAIAVLPENDGHV